MAAAARVLSGPPAAAREVPNVDYIYWTFTAAAQSVAAFVGLLLAGYALVHSLMEAARERDETLDEIHGALRMRFHRWLTLLAALTCLAIVLSLVVVFTNRWEFPGKYVIVAIVGLIDIASVVCGLAFVVVTSLVVVFTNRWEFPGKYVLASLVAVIDFSAIICGAAFVVVTSHPARYTLTAERVLAAREPDLKLSGETVPVGKFFAVNGRLERALRKAFQAADIEHGGNGRTPSFRQMADALLQNERIDADLHRELIVIMQYRNLVYHGHVTTADKTMLDRVQAALKKLATASTSHALTVVSG